MSKKTKALVFNFIGFAILFFLSRYFIETYTALIGYWIPITAFVVSTLLAPKFQTVITAQGEKLFMKWIFIKNLIEIK